MTYKKILIVDDLRLNRITFAEILKDNYEAIEAVDGKEALELLEQYREDIAAIILDLIMPVLDGYEFLEEFRVRIRQMQIFRLLCRPHRVIPKMKNVA